MKKLLFLLIFFLVAPDAFSQNAATNSPTPTTTFVIFRTSQRLDSPHVATWHYFEVFQARGKWIYPDIGYVDFGSGRYREIYIGGGRTLVDSNRVTLIEELYFDQAFGPDAKNARYLQPWTLFQFRFAPKVMSEIVCFPYLPLNRSARVQYVLEHAKLEYSLAKNWKVGGGYGGYKYGNDSWQHKPLLTTTLSTRAGEFEFWLQKMPNGAQVQLRYLLMHTSR